MIDIEKWTADYLREVEQTFGTRIAFVGIQGSYARGEAKEDSDIDMVLILDHLEPADLPRYREAVEELPERRLLCGFVSGLDELKCWDRADLFQFCHDTLPIRGSLEELLRKISRADVRRAVHVSACNIYHGCVHNALHERDCQMLKALYKSARFALQALYFYRTGRYVTRKEELLAVLESDEKRILSAADFSEETFDEQSQLLQQWTSGLIVSMGDRQD